ncbi:hypothetical protein NDU88_010957 [Pleurodeles waltl]|uniref:Uncharacterized protein n=1 Tax=Pleurodeles waltl TaxID=8319 RepID=A0AAV7Q3Q0_PLEWA|nr:hypothetical protein NDU88_010957 [Pleurodeles waltl]
MLLPPHHAWFYEVVNLQSHLAQCSTSSNTNVMAHSTALGAAANRSQKKSNRRLTEVVSEQQLVVRRQNVEKSRRVPL